MVSRAAPPTIQKDGIDVYWQDHGADDNSGRDEPSWGEVWIRLGNNLHRFEELDIDLNVGNDDAYCAESDDR